jgi:hypothetical protein
VAVDGNALTMPVYHVVNIELNFIQKFQGEILRLAIKFEFSKRSLNHGVLSVIVLEITIVECHTIKKIHKEDIFFIMTEYGANQGSDRV